MDLRRAVRRLGGGVRMRVWRGGRWMGGRMGGGPLREERQTE